MPDNFFASPGVIPSNDVKGDATGGNAPAGFIGEYVTAGTVGWTNIGVSSTVWTDMGDLILSPGDWDMGMAVGFKANGSSATIVDFGFGLSAGNLAPGGSGYPTTFMEMPWQATATADPTHAMNPLRWAVGVTTTVYLKLNITYQSGSPQWQMKAQARRVR